MFGPNRTLCEVFQDMRNTYDTRNFSYLQGLIEEAQYLANRMEAQLEDQRDYKSIQEHLSELKKKREKLMKQVNELEKRIESDEDE